MERKLTTILHADVKGYSRLIGEDDETTIHTLSAYLEMMGALVRQHGGQAIGSRGDSLLAEFPSVMDDSRWHYVLDLIPQGKCFDDSNRVVELTQKCKRMEFAHELMIIIDQYCQQVISQLKSHKND